MFRSGMIGAWISKGLGQTRPRSLQNGRGRLSVDWEELFGRGPARDTPDPFQLGPVTMSVV